MIIEHILLFILVFLQILSIGIIAYLWRRKQPIQYLKDDYPVLSEPFATVTNTSLASHAESEVYKASTSENKTDTSKEVQHLQHMFDELQRSHGQTLVMLEEIRRNEKKYREFAEMLPEIVYEVDTQGNLLFVNKRAFEIFGYTREEFDAGLNIFSMLHPQDRLKVQENMQQIARDSDISGFEYRMFSRKGKMLYVSAHSLPVFENDILVGFRGLLIDISDRKRNQKDLMMALYTVENSGDLIFWVDEMGTVFYMNDTACQKLGLDKNPQSRYKVFNILHPADAEFWLHIMEDLNYKKSLELEANYQTAPGGLLAVEVVFSKILFEDKPVYLAFARDVSQKKANEELQRKVQLAHQSAMLKQQFLANMSHEIRTPMTGIMGMTSLLGRTELDEVQQEYVRNIKISSENLLNIINDILDLSKIEAGKMELKPEKIKLQPFVEQIVDVFTLLARQKDLTLDAWISPEIPAYIFIDDNRLKQIINNLLSNAFKFTREGGVKIAFNLIKKTQNEVSLQCQISDTGVGITPENQRQIFEKFTQIDNSLTRPFEGTGLGLAICRELCTLMGGSIGVKSTPGQGSVFTFTVKAGYDTSDEKPARNESDMPSESLDMQILLAEDKLLNQKVVGLILSNAGCKVDFAVNGKETLDFYIPGKYDVILMDIQMPVMDGITAYKELKKKYGKLCPVIGISANALEGDAEKYLSEGLDDYISKPFKPELLYAKLKYWRGKFNQSVAQSPE